jgi:hypothetical protein
MMVSLKDGLLGNETCYARLFNLLQSPEPIEGQKIMSSDLHVYAGTHTHTHTHTHTLPSGRRKMKTKLPNCFLFNIKIGVG